MCDAQGRMKVAAERRAAQGPPREINRRDFLQSALAIAAVSRLGAQNLAMSEWGGPVLDIHLHLRPGPDGNFNHIEGSGVTRPKISVFAARPTT
jgi:hypothetical protein